MNTRSLRFQLGLWYAGLLMGVFLLIGVATVLALKNYLDANVRESQLRRATQIGQALTPPVTQQGQAAISDEIEARFAPGANNRFVRVRRADGTVVYRSTPPQDRSFDPDTIPLGRWPEGSNSSRVAGLPGGGQMLIVSHAFRNARGTSWLIESGSPLDTVQAVLRHVIYVMAITLLLAVAVAVIGGYFLVGRALAAVDHLSRSAERISSQNLSERLPEVQTGDEIERLSLALNRMIQRLDEAFQHSKRFVADASHELRTPLTVLRGELEALVEREPLQGVVRERLGSLLEEVDRLAKVVEGLLILSRLDAGEAQGESVRVDLARLTISTADQMGLLAEDKRIAISREAPAPVMVEGDRTRLKQVIVNLLDNAIKYTPEGGKVTLQVRAEGTHAVLDVVDNGIGIAPEMLPHVFERFFRADKARSRDLGGAGLGLAIVQSICTAHGGVVSVHSKEGQGSQFTVVLPLALAPGDQRHPEKEQTPIATSRTSAPAIQQQPRRLSNHSERTAATPTPKNHTILYGN